MRVCICVCWVFHLFTLHFGCWFWFCRRCSLVRAPVFKVFPSFSLFIHFFFLIFVWVPPDSLFRCEHQTLSTSTRNWAAEQLGKAESFRPRNTMEMAHREWARHGAQAHRGAVAALFSSKSGRNRGGSGPKHLWLKEGFHVAGCLATRLNVAPAINRVATSREMSALLHTLVRLEMPALFEAIYIDRYKV